MNAYSCLFLLIGTSAVFSADVLNGTYKLILVQAIWRHGDRTPTETYHNDKFTEDYWNMGGGGWGQLTPNGMRQQLQLGRQMRDRYIKGNPFKFLKPNYDQQEVFVRSTDKNRTLLSAFSNMIGMYGDQDGENYNRAGIDYPAVEGWPKGLVPIPIHTINEGSDHLLVVDNYCPIQSQVWGMAKQTTQVQSYFNSTNVTTLMNTLSNYCGEEINPENLWILRGALTIEKQNYPLIFQNMTPWYTDELYAQLDAVNTQVQDFQDGIGIEGVFVNEIDVGKTLRKIRGGTLINDLYNRMQRKLDCENQTGPECIYTNKLKFQAYSAHDTTLYSLLSLLNATKIAVQPPGYPLYASCILLELWEDTTTNAPFFKLIYHRNENDTLSNVITTAVPGCASEWCSLEIFKTYATFYAPPMDLNSWCNVDILKKSGFNASYLLSIIFTFIFLSNL